MIFKMNLRQLQIQHCGLCEQIIDIDKRKSTMKATELFGVAAYAICPCCCQQIDRQTQSNTTWRQRVNDWIKKTTVTGPG
jgi:uncharacterized protein YlaI